MTPYPVSIALVDDYAPLRNFMRQYLSANGFITVCEANNGLDLLDKLNGRTRLPDTCLLNINMPLMDGYETASQLRKHYPSIRIMAFSFHDDKKRVDKIIGCGAHGFICKDATPEEIRDALLVLHNRSTSPFNALLQLSESEPAHV